MKKIFFFPIFVTAFTLASSNCSYAQGGRSDVISPAGGYAGNNLLSLEWTLGEMAVETISGNKNIFTQGFHQPYLLKKYSPVLQILDITPGYLFTAAPNPVVSELNVAIKGKIASKVQVQLTDAFGRTISWYTPSYKSSYKFSLINQPSGQYYVFIRDEKTLVLKCFSIIKAN